MQPDMMLSISINQMIINAFLPFMITMHQLMRPDKLFNPSQVKMAS